MGLASVHPMSIPAPRYEIRLSLILILYDPAGRFRGVTRNISESGMLVASSATRPRGALVHFESLTFSGGAEVIWTRETDEEEMLPGSMFVEEKMLLGLKFVELSRRDGKALQEFLEQYAC